ncbi:hypothetical protein Ade02nite_20250 [Paractinoplanes deccanensis]|uniref:Uncharacterized protein n=1 Tax=Paractinoplanes deccanensis TaxID=113561 RepID=A0ABQ3Y059_9ACTN|nr:hypothetical protein [Actinoplanes deccanensis]GID73384.1 hypothetical protein Ade02nite_20250 [Actinoplanes deccanensis]
MKHHTIALTRVQLDAIGNGRLVRIATDHGLLTISNAPWSGAVRLWQTAHHQLRTGHAVEFDDRELDARFTFLPVTESLMGASR